MRLRKCSCAYSARQIFTGGNPKMENLKKKKITLEDFEWGDFPVQEVMTLEGEEKIVHSWQGKSPTTVLKCMARMYLERYEDSLMPPLGNKAKSASPEQIWLKWIVKNGNSWGGLDRKLKEAARLCVDIPEQLAFWDKMRYLAREVQPEHSRSTRKTVQEIKRRVEGGEYEVVILEGKEYRITEESKYIFSMGVCRYCWRAAFKIPGYKWCYCHLCERDCDDDKIATSHNNKNRIKHSNKIRPHDLYITSNEYMTIFETCQPSTKIRLTVQNGEKQAVSGYLTLQKAWERYPRHVLGLFPQVLNYLTEQNANIDSTQDIIAKLEFPPQKSEESPTKTNVRNVHYLTCSFDYAVIVEHLIWAEIWLRYQADQPKHGGARKGAGRPQKYPIVVSKD